MIIKVLIKCKKVINLQKIIYHLNYRLFIIAKFFIMLNLLFIIIRYLYISLIHQTSMQNNFHYMFKYIVIGDPAVGKSSLLLQFTENIYTPSYQATLGVEFGLKFFEANHKTIKAMIWDTAGQQTFKSIIRSYYRGAIIALVVYDITNRSSFENLWKWLQQINTHSNEFVQIVLVGNKCDLQGQRQVTLEQGKNFAASAVKEQSKKQFLFFEVSAKQNKDVFKPFEMSAAKIVDRIEKKQIELSAGLNIGIKVGIPQTEGEEVTQIEQSNKKITVNTKNVNVNTNKNFCC